MVIWHMLSYMIIYFIMSYLFIYLFINTFCFQTCRFLSGLSKWINAFYLLPFFLLQYRTSWQEQENPSEDTGGEEDGQPDVQPHHGVRRLSTRGPQRGLCGDHSVGSRPTEQSLHRRSEAWARDRWDSIPLLLFSAWLRLVWMCLIYVFELISTWY